MHLLNISRDGNSTTAQGTLFQYLTTLPVKKFSPACNPDLPLPLTPHLWSRLTPANQAQLCQVAVDVDAEDLDKEEVELAAFQRRPGEAAEQAVVGEPPQDPTAAWVGPAREPTVEQEGQVEEEQAAHEVHMQPQVDADGLLKPEPAPECPRGHR